MACEIRRIAVLALTLFAATACALRDAGHLNDATAAPRLAPPIEYPETRTVDQIDEYHGIRVRDPYRWLEGDVRKTPEVAKWVEMQNKVTFEYLDSLEVRKTLENKLRELWDYEKFTLPEKRGNRYFYQHNDGLQPQFVLAMQESLADERKTLIDPNTWSGDGNKALSLTYPSNDGAFVAYKVQENGSDWNNIQVLNVNTQETMPETLRWVKGGSVEWAKDNSGFYYTRFPAPGSGAEYQHVNLGQKIYFHRLGDEQAKDRLVYSRPDHPNHNFATRLSSDGSTLVVTVWKSSDGLVEVLLIDVDDPKGKPVPLVSGFTDKYQYIATTSGRHYFFTYKDAPRGKVVATPGTAGQPSPQWVEVLPQRDAVLSSASIVGGRLFANYIKDVKSVVRVYGLDGNFLRELPLPGVGTASGFGGEPNDSETFFGFESLNRPYTIYRYDIPSDKIETFRRPNVSFDPDDYVVRQVFYKSRDGTTVPMFIAHRKDVDMRRGAPTMLYGYGGFSHSQMAYYSVSRIAWMELGGVFAIANIRGGGEYGQAWHDAGRLLNKQNTFDDFIGAAEFLIKEGITTREKLGIFGASNGGLLVGAVINQRPDLFSAGVAAVGVMDMLRYDKFTSGRLWAGDYGDPAKEADFRNLYAYSPYHNIRDGVRYPAILVTTADTDDRVVPGHSFKYAAALQNADIGPGPHLIRIDSQSGHGSGTPTDQMIRSFTDMWAFLAEHTGLGSGD